MRAIFGHKKTPPIGGAKKFDRQVKKIQEVYVLSLGLMRQNHGRNSTQLEIRVCKHNIATTKPIDFKETKPFRLVLRNEI
ncbi:hypothetical protein VII00023_20917 [Vibrio ichthyoenteri ATCC 700023]|uniref:Uncharacterized protein n=1 Tax=Vibrio ichthyoenteri ATCC 700023 TaxID=870968 RepID=F9RX93_9VIBR|nr:hypothetical protein VII00023_20917 [Vibrio ichthyoenteri ATCC 700023]